MSENNNNSVDIEEIVSDEEYKEALEKLNTPKSEEGERLLRQRRPRKRLR